MDRTERRAACQAAHTAGERSARASERSARGTDGAGLREPDGHGRRAAEIERDCRRRRRVPCRPSAATRRALVGAVANRHRESFRPADSDAIIVGRELRSTHVPDRSPWARGLATLTVCGNDAPTVGATTEGVTP